MKNLCFIFLIFISLTANSAQGLEQASCNKENALTCLAAADKLFDDQAFDEAIKLYKNLCALDDAFACLREGYIHDVVNNEFGKASPLYRKGCDLGDGTACSNLGKMYEAGESLKVNYQTANDLHKKGCELESAFACRQLSINYYRGVGLPESAEKSFEYDKLACDYGDADSCDDAADYYDDREQFEQSTNYYQKACRLYSGYGCRVLGWNIENGKGVDADLSSANRLYKTACDLGDPYGCRNFAVALAEPEGTDPELKQDAKTAFKLAKAVCFDDDVAEACVNAGYWLEQGHGVDKNIDQAIEYYIRGCDELEHPSEVGCYNLGVHYSNQGKRRKSKTYYRKACDLGDQDACDSL